MKLLLKNTIFDNTLEEFYGFFFLHKKIIEKLL